MAPAATPLDAARAQFAGTRGYLNAAAMGLLPRAAVDAMHADIDAAHAGARTPPDYAPAVERSRELYARLVGVPTRDVAVGSQTSVLAAVVAAWLPPGAEVLVPDGDFTSMTYPFVVRGDLTVRPVPVERLAESVTARTALVAFSLVQSATGEVADVDALLAQCARHGTRTFCDVTQAAGVLPVDAARFDLTVCHAYKWLCAPRGAAFLTVRAELQPAIPPVQAGWYAGRDVWSSCYGTTPDLAPDARRFDVSPAWLVWVGAAPALELFTGLDIGRVWAHATRLADRLLDELGEPVRHHAIATVPDAAGERLRAVTAAGVRASGRAGRLRLAFHLWNDDDDVDLVLRALQPLRVGA